jgi:hypothetical protein
MNVRAYLDWPRIVLALLCLFATGFQVRHVAGTLRMMREPQELPQRPLGTALESNTIRYLGPGAYDAGIRNGDRLLAIDGRPVRGFADVTRGYRAHRPGEFVQLSVAREGAPGRDYSLRLLPVREQPFTLDGWFYNFILSAFVPLLCTALGFAAAFARPRDVRAWMVLLLLLSFPHITDLMATWIPTWDGPSIAAGYLYHGFFNATWGLWLMLFAYHFPDARSSLGIVKWWRWLAIPYLCATGLSQGFARALGAFSYEAGAPLVRLYAALLTGQTWVLMPTIGAFFANTGY